MFVGLRLEVCGDQFNYEAIYLNMVGASFPKLLYKRDLAHYYLLNELFLAARRGIYFIKLVAGLLFSVGVVEFSFLPVCLTC